MTLSPISDLRVEKVVGVLKALFMLRKGRVK
jgi:hypothetical protein